MKILAKHLLAETGDTLITRMDIQAPLIARKALPGNFVVLIVNEKGERIPLTVVATDTKRGSVTLIFQEIGFSTKLLGKLDVGDSIYALSGPLGRHTEIKKYGKVILVGGGVGIAEIYPAARAFKKKGNHVTTIIGARTKDLLILEEELKKVSDELHITTDDGSCGRKGFTTDVLKELLAYSLKLKAYSLIYAVGPIPMMKRISEVSKNSKTKTLVSLNSLMVDATGMCGVCRVTVGGKTKFTCVDGPEFDAHEVDWDELDKRNRVYTDKESHICKLYEKRSN